MNVCLGIKGLVCLGVSIGYCDSFCVSATVLSALIKAPDGTETVVEKKELYKEKERDNTVASTTPRWMRPSIHKSTALFFLK